MAKITTYVRFLLSFLLFGFIGGELWGTGFPVQPVGQAAPAAELSNALQGACGPLDIAFVIDDTGSMGPALDNIKTDLLSILSTIESQSSNNYRLALVTFKDNVTVVENFAANNRAATEAGIRKLSASGGRGGPEASDEALNTVINRLPAAGRSQIGNFTQAFRPEAKKIVILLTDAPPAGFDDDFTIGVDDKNARQRAQEAASKGIQISAIFVPTDGDYAGQRAIMRDYAAISGGAFIETTDEGLGTANAISGIILRCGGPALPADLSISSSVLPNPVFAGGNLVYTITIRNAGSNTASDPLLLAAVPNRSAFQSLTAPPDWRCALPAVGDDGFVSCGAISLAAGATATFTLTVQVDCAAPDGLTIASTASIRASSPDLQVGNNNSTLNVTVRATASRASITLSSGKSSFEFGPTSAVSTVSSNAPSETFTIENPGCLPVTIRLRRIGGEVSNGKISDPDDSAIFSLFAVNSDGSETPVAINPGASPIQLTGGQRQTFRLRFHPLIPILSGKTSGLFANQAIPDVINSQLIVSQQGSTPTTVGVTARVNTPVQLIHPADSRLAPLIVFTRASLEYTVECSVHDPNLDLYLARYQFLDRNDLAVGQPVDVNLTQPIAQRDLVRGQSFTIIQRFVGALQPNVAKVQITLFDREIAVSSARISLGTAEPVLANVSAASFRAADLASESIVAAFGSSLASGTQSASIVPLPTSLLGTSVRVRDGAGVERLAPLFFVSSSQINYQIPQGTRVGAATVTVLRDGQAVSREVAQIAATAPALFSANATGSGLPAAVALRVTAEGVQRFESIFNFEAARNLFTPVPLNFGQPGEQLFLILFGTGVRFHNSQNPVTAKVGGLDAEVFYAGPQGSFVGLDQINILLPRALAGRGNVDVVLAVGGKQSNAVQVNFGNGVSTLTSPVDWLAAGLQREGGKLTDQRAQSDDPPVLRLTPIQMPQVQPQSAPGRTPARRIR